MEKNIIVILIVSLFVIGIGAGFVYLMKSNTKYEVENDELKKEIEKMKKEQKETDAIREEIKQISEYAAYEFNYTSILYLSGKNNFYGFQLPGTGNRFIATIDGTIKIGIKCDNVALEQETGKDGQVTAVNISVPHSEILDNYPISDTLTVYDEKNNIFNPVTPEDYNELLSDAQKEEAKKVQKSDLLKKSDESIEYLLTSHLQAVYGEDVTVNFQYIDAKEDADNAKK